MKTITFTPKAEIRKGFRCLGIGFKHIAKGLFTAYDKSLHKYPYVHLYILFFVMTLVYVCYVGKTRAERDSLSKDIYHLREQMDSIQSVNGIKEVRAIYED